jgi:pyruvate dehydrogenase E2 component (dihydrolipoamide acetyltransferase)
VAETVVMPKVGLTAREALLREWLVEVGQEVAVGEPLCEIETDKIVNEMESPVSGVLLKRIDTEIVVPVGEPIAVIGDRDEEVESTPLFAGGGANAKDQQDEEGGLRVEAEVPPTRRDGAAAPGRAAVSPVARRLAKELGVDLATVAGSGPGGRVTRRDVEVAAGGAGPPPAAEDVVPSSPAAFTSEARREEPSRLRQAIAAAMTASASVPQFSLERDVEITELVETLQERSLGLERPLSVADAIGVATARAIRGHPEFLRSWEDGAFRVSDDVALGLAVAVEDGLIVPVLHGADRLTVEVFSEQRKYLQDRTLQGRLSTSESMGAVFTISNLGPLGVDRFRALVNPPESGILALGRSWKVNGRSLMTLSLSADHRVVDGAQGARLLDEIAWFFEDENGRRELLSPPA